MTERKFVGPVRPGTSEKKFRETGESVRLVRGPVRPGTDVEKFRETGESVKVSGAGGGSSSGRRQVGPTREQLESGREIQESIKKAKEDKALANRLAADRTQEALRSRVRRVVGRTQQDIQRDLQRQRTGATAREQALAAIKSPVTAISTISAEAGRLAGVATERVAPGGIPITIKAKPERQVRSLEPLFGTTQLDPVTGETIKEGRKITLPAEPERTVNIFTPKKVKEGVRFGTGLSLFAVAPAAVVSPALVAEGVETALDPTKSKGERLLGVAEAELGLLVGGLKVRSLVKDLDPVAIQTLREASELKGIGKGGKVRLTQKQVQKAIEKAKKKKKVTKEDVKYFLEKGTLKIEGGKPKLVEVSKTNLTFTEKANKARLLLQNAKTPQSRREVLNVIRETYGKDFLADFVQQEGVSLIPEVATSRITSQVIEVTAPKRIQPSITSTRFDLLQVPATAIDQRTGQDQFQPLASAQQALQSTAQDQKPLQLFGPAQAIAQETSQKTDQRTDLFTGLASVLKTSQQQVQPQTKRLGQPKQPRTRQPKPKGILPRIPPAKKKPSAKAILKQAGWIGEVKEGGKWKKVNPKRPLKKAEAQKLANLVADNTIGASTRTTKANKPAQAALKKLASIGFKFRKSKNKATPNVQVEKRKFRLDRPKETQTIQQFKRSAKYKGSFKKKSKKKKSTSRRNTGINWFS